MLTDIRILEISGPETMMAGKILADLGADVVVIEPPAGAPGRRLGPFLDDVPGLERSLTWQALNRGKRSVTLDLTGDDGLSIFRTLGATADVILEAPGAVPAVGITDSDRPMNTICCSIRPFAASGPKSEYATSDLILGAASGAWALAGEPDRPPTVFPVPQSMSHAGADAAIGVLAALVARGRSVPAQHVEVSARISALLADFSQPLVIGSGSKLITRADQARNPVPNTFACLDGYVILTVAFGRSWGPLTQRLSAWAHQEGHLSESAANVDWSSFGGRSSGEREQLQALVDGIRSLCRTKTKMQVEDASLEHGFLGAAVLDMADVAASDHYRARGLWAEALVNGLDEPVSIPAHFPKFSNYEVGEGRPAPSLGEHTSEILGAELHFSSLEISALFSHGIV